MKVKFFSILVSIVFIPVAMLGQYLGFYLGKILYFIYERIMFLNMPDFLGVTFLGSSAGVLFEKLLL